MKKLLILGVLLPIYACTTSVAEKGFISRIQHRFTFFQKKPDTDRVIERYEQTERQAIKATQTVDSTLECKVEATAYRIDALKARIRQLTKENEELQYRVFDLETLVDNCDNVIDLRKSTDSLRIAHLRPYYGKR